MVPEVGIAPTSPPLQGGANLPQLLGVEMVVPAGNAPASSGYQPGALLLSYRTWMEVIECEMNVPGIGRSAFRISSALHHPLLSGFSQETPRYASSPIPSPC